MEETSEPTSDLRCPPAYHDELGVKAVNGLLDRRGDGRFVLIFKGLDVRIGLPAAEVLFNCRDELVRIEVPRGADGDVVGDVEV